MEKKKKKQQGVKPDRVNTVYAKSTLAMLIRLQKKKVLTYTELRFEQVWCGQLWRAHTFPRMTPVKTIAEKLHCSEAPLRKALLRGQGNINQWDIVRN